MRYWVVKRQFFLLMVLGIFGFALASAQRLNDKLLNRPYADLKAWHLGFSVGVHAQDLTFTHSGYVTEDGEQWVMEQPAFSPGFCVNGLIDFRLNTHFNVRLSPGLWFGNKVVEMRELHSGQTQRQNIKSTLIVMPVDLKFSSLRYRNTRPYLTAGVVPTFDVGKHRMSDLIQLQKFDCMLSVGLGCDVYFPYFKFIPEIKFCWGLTDLLRHKRPDLAEDPLSMRYTQSLSKVTQKMIVLTFYFE